MGEVEEPTEHESRHHDGRQTLESILSEWVEVCDWLDLGSEGGRVCSWVAKSDRREGCEGRYVCRNRKRETERV